MPFENLKRQRGWGGGAAPFVYCFLWFIMMTVVVMALLLLWLLLLLLLFLVPALGVMLIGFLVPLVVALALVLVPGQCSSL